jgi:hypothetical protein
MPRGVQGMHAEKQPTVAVQYPKVWFGVGAAVCAAGMSLSAYLAYGSIEEFARTFWLVVLTGLALILALFIVPCIITAHAAGEKGLHLRMGFLINATIPYDAIREIGPDTIKRGALSVGIGVRHKERKGMVFVVSSFKDLVAIKLNREVRLGGILGPAVGQIVLSVKDVDSFLSTIALMSGAREE